MNRYGSQKSGFTFKDAKLDALTEGDEVYIYETHEGWGVSIRAEQVVTKATVGYGSST